MMPRVQRGSWPRAKKGRGREEKNEVPWARYEAGLELLGVGLGLLKR